MKSAASPNAAQIEYWNGPAGQRWAKAQDQIDHHLGLITEVLMAFAAPKLNERVLAGEDGNQRFFHHILLADDDLGHFLPRLRQHLLQMIRIHIFINWLWTRNLKPAPRNFP